MFNVLVKFLPLFFNLNTISHLIYYLCMCTLHLRNWTCIGKLFTDSLQVHPHHAGLHHKMNVGFPLLAIPPFLLLVTGESNRLQLYIPNSFLISLQIILRFSARPLTVILVCGTFHQTFSPSNIPLNAFTAEENSGLICDDDDDHESSSP